MPVPSIDAVEKTISSTILVYYYDKYSAEHAQDYPEVKNPSALLDGITGVVKAIGEGRVPDNTILYVLEDEDDARDPRRAQYVITITKGNGPKTPEGYAIRLFYSKTQEGESISTFEENQVVWSPDNMKNTKHPNRTKYYLGFAYMLCDKSPGFDTEPMPEREITGAELLNIIKEGEIPPELIEISVPDQFETTETEQQETEQSLFEEEVPEHDDVEIMVPTQEEYDEYDDLQTDYEELFD